MESKSSWQALFPPTPQYLYTTNKTGYNAERTVEGRNIHIFNVNMQAGRARIYANMHGGCLYMLHLPQKKERTIIRSSPLREESARPERAGH